MSKRAEYPKSEGEIRAQQEILQTKAERKMELHLGIRERLQTYDHLLADVLIAQGKVKALRGKIENLSRLAESSTLQDRFADAIEKARQEENSTTEVLAEAEYRLEKLETEILILAAELAAIDKEKEESVTSLEELIRLVEERITEKLKMPDENIARVEQEIETLTSQIQERIEKLQKQYRELTGSDLSISSIHTAAWMDERRGRIYEASSRKIQAHSEEDHDLKNWLKRAKNLEYDTERQNYTPEQVLKGELVSDVRQMVEEAQQEIDRHQEKKPGTVSMFFTGGGEWSKRSLQLEDKVRKAKRQLEEAQREEDHLRKEFEKRQARIETHENQGVGLREIAEKIGQIIHMASDRERKKEGIAEIANYKTRMTRNDRDQIRQLEVTMQKLGYDIQHPLMRRIEDMLKEQTQEEERVKAA